MSRAGAADSRKRKHRGEEEELSSCSSSLDSVKRSCRKGDSEENSDDERAIPSSDRALSSSSPSSNASSNVVVANDKYTTVDSKVEGGEASSVLPPYHLKLRDRRRTTQASGELEAESATTICPSVDNSRCHHTTAVKMPSDDAELEEFFSAAEKDLQKQFTQKYNFDIEKEEAVEGRFTWICVKP